MNKAFTHIHTAHCENGVTTNLIKQEGYDFMNEPLAFGIGSGLFYIHLPFIKLNNGPAISFRNMPGIIFKQTCKSLNIKVESSRFRNEFEAQRELDKLLSEGHIVGCQVGVYNLSYFPIEYRFHFNAHNLIVYGKEGDNYLISDPVMDKVTTLSSEELNRVRFAQGIFAPKGHLYYIKNSKAFSPEIIQKGISKGIRRNVQHMLYIPGNIGGVDGIKYTAGKIRKWRDQLGPRKAGQFLGQIIRMQEEIGTGGGGFRFIYAAFMEECANHMANDKFLGISDQFTLAGDMWRKSAVNMAAVMKGRATEQKDFDAIADHLIEISKIEKQAFRDLSKIKLTR